MATTVVQATAMFQQKPLLNKGNTITLFGGLPTRLNLDALVQELQRNYCIGMGLPPAPNSPWTPVTAPNVGIYWITDTEGYEGSFADFSYLDSLTELAQYV